MNINIFFTVLRSLIVGLVFVSSSAFAEMYKWIQENLDYDQMIWEFGTDTQPNWIHISYVSKEENRNKCLKAYKEHGKTKYKVISS